MTKKISLQTFLNKRQKLTLVPGIGTARKINKSTTLNIPCIILKTRILNPKVVQLKVIQDNYFSLALELEIRAFKICKHKQFVF
jgi:hypothetical protein